MARINVPLKPNEKDALIALAIRERRDPRDQAALIVVRELERHGLLSANDLPLVPLTEPARGHA